MPSVSRRKAKQAKRLKTLTNINNHSTSVDQLQGVANHSKKMEESLNGTWQESQQKVETLSLSEDKEAAVEVDDDSPDVDVAITDEEAPQGEEHMEVDESGKVEEETQEDVSESVAETVEFDTVKDVQVDNSVESVSVVECALVNEEKQEENFVTDPDVVNDEVKETDFPPSVSGDEGLKETEVVADEEEKNVLSSVVVTERESEEPNEVDGDSFLPPADVASEETVETSIPKSDESEKVASTIIEKSLDLEPTLGEKVEAPSGDQEESSYESVKESLQPSTTVYEAENTENPTNAPVAQTENSSWRSCCGILEIILGGGR